MAYVAECYCELHMLNEVPSVGNEPLALPAPLGLLGVDLEILAQQIQRGLGPYPVMSDHRQMFYMLANVHHQIATGEVLLCNTPGVRHH